MTTRHIHLHFPIRQAGRLVTRDQVPGSVPGAKQHPPQAVAALVNALMQAIADRKQQQGAGTTDAFEESKHPRGKGGQFAKGSGGGGSKSDPHVQHLSRGTAHPYGHLSRIKPYVEQDPRIRALNSKSGSGGGKAATSSSSHGGALRNMYTPDDTKVVSPTHPNSGYKPGQILYATDDRGGWNSKKQYRVLGHNAAGEVVHQSMQKDGGIFAMDPESVKILTTTGAKTKGKSSTKDAGEWEESKHPRSDGGQFSSGQHTEAAENHTAAATAHENSAKMSGAGPLAAMHMKAAGAHKDAAESHTAAASHLDSGTGLGEEMAKQAHGKTFQAARHSQKMDKLAGGNTMGAAYAHLKKKAADPKAPVAARAEAIKQLQQIEKSSALVAKSPHAQQQAAPDDTVAAKHLPARHPMPGSPREAPDARRMHGIGIKPVASRADLSAQLARTGENPIDQHSPHPDARGVGEKPTSSTVKQSKAAVHQLLSTGHPFSVEELMKATGVASRTTLMTALSDLKNPKYAGALGALQIAKRTDGMYHVAQAPTGGFKAMAGAGAGQAPAQGAPAAAGGAAASGEPAAVDPLKVTQATHPMSDYVPGQMLTAKGQKGNQYKVLGHNAEGHVVVQNADGSMTHHMDPSELAKNSTLGVMVAPAPTYGKRTPEQDQEDAENAFESYSGPMDDKSVEIAGFEMGEEQRRQNEHYARLARKAARLASGRAEIREIDKQDEDAAQTRHDDNKKPPMFKKAPGPLAPPARQPTGKEMNKTFARLMEKAKKTPSHSDLAQAAHYTKQEMTHKSAATKPLVSKNQPPSGTTPELEAAKAAALAKPGLKASGRLKKPPGKA